MKCLYYLAPTLGSTRSISDDLHAVGVSDGYIHVVSRDEAGLKKERIRENRELKRANEISRTASAFFAQAELDRRLK